MFCDLPSASSEEPFVAQIEMIDLHHGPYSADPPYTVIEAFGTAATDKIKVELSQLGFNDLQQNSDGFTAVRPKQGIAP
jgi:hypothetical protein